MHIYKWSKRHISTIAFVLGFIGDALTLRNIDSVYENAVFITYLVVALTGIILIHGVETGKWRHPTLVNMRSWLPAMIQFPMGGLFSGFLVFYTKSAAFFASWPFITILSVVFVGNEFLRKRYERLVFQVGMLYFALLCYMVLAVPAIVDTIGTSTFILSVCISLALILVVLQIIKRLFPRLYKMSVRPLRLTIAGIAFTFCFMYFTNIIPPVPLVLKDIGIYHDVVRTASGSYRVRYEAPPWYMFWRATSPVYHRAQHEGAHCFASVFAPVDMNTRVYHSWQRKNEDGVWERRLRVSYPARGGREGGYRGYTTKITIPAGEWKCVVETEDGRVIGETWFRVVGVDHAYAQLEGVR